MPWHVLHLARLSRIDYPACDTLKIMVARKDTAEPKIVTATKDAMVAAGVDEAVVNATAGEDIFNSVLDAMPQEYSRSVDYATAGFKNIVGIGQQIMADEDITNAWISALINRIGKVVFDRIELENPLAVFKRGIMTNGKMIEELAIDSASGYRFSPQIAETELFKRVLPKASVLVHTADRAMTYPATFQDNYLNDAFTSFEQLDQFVAGQIESMVNGNLDDEFYDTKLLLSNAVAKNVVAQSTYNPADIKNVQKDILANIRAMGINNRNYNRAFGPGVPGIKTRTKLEDLVVLMDIPTSVDLDVDFWAQIFHTDRAEAAVRMIVIDKFEDVWTYTADYTVVEADITGDDPYLDPREWKVDDIVPAGAFAKAGATGATKTFDGSKMHYWLGDKAAIQIWDRKLPKIKTTENPMGMYINAFLQVREVISYSQIMQSVVGIEAATEA